MQDKIGVIVTGKGRYAHEVGLAKLVKDLLEYARFPGEFEVRIPQKIKGGGDHHGVEICGIEYNSVRLKIQPGDSGTRFLGYLRGQGIRPADILCRLTAAVRGGHFCPDLPQQPVRAVAEEKVSAPEHEIARLRTLARQHRESFELLEELRAQERSCAAELKALRRQMDDAQKRRDGLLARVEEHRRVVESPQHRDAVARIQEIDRIAAR